MATPSATFPPQSGVPARTFQPPWMLLGIIVVLLVLAIAGGYWFFIGRFIQSTDDAYVGGDVTVVAPKVGGFISEILVQDNQHVSAHQVLMRLDARDYDARLAQATAALAGAQAAVVELEAKQSLQAAVINTQQAALQAADAELTRSTADQNRYRQLVKDDAVSSQLAERADADLGKARAAVASGHAGVLAAQRQLSVLQAQTADAQAGVAKAQAEQRAAALNVSYTTIRAPLDGYIGNRTARAGMLATTGVSLLTVVPSTGLWVDANFKEDQLRQMRVGDQVDVTLDALSEPLQGVVASIAPATGGTFSILPAENATGNFTKIVQRVPVRIRLEVPKALQGKLRPGLSATVKVHLNVVNGKHV